MRPRVRHYPARIVTATRARRVFGHIVLSGRGRLTLMRVDDGTGIGLELRQAGS
jgi:hypothetical protein